MTLILFGLFVLFAGVMLVVLHRIHCVQRQDLDDIMGKHGYVLQDVHDTQQKFKYPGRLEAKRQVSLKEFILYRPLREIPCFKEIIFNDRQGDPVVCLAAFIEERYGPARIFFNIDLETLQPLEEAA